MLSQQIEDHSEDSVFGLVGRFQQTLAAAFERSGVGLHSGQAVRVRVLPAEPGQGRYFVRTDLPDAVKIPARVEAVSQTTLSTELAQGGSRVRTVEHLLAALAGMGVDNARIEIDGPEVSVVRWFGPILGERDCSGGDSGSTDGKDWALTQRTNICSAGRRFCQCHPCL